MTKPVQLPVTDWKKHPFLEGMNEECLNILASCAMPTEFKPGELIFREDEVANRFYLLCEGRVAIEAEALDRPPAKVDEVCGGSVLGWSWLFPPYTWHFAARAITPTKAMFFYGTWLRESCDENHDLGYELMKRTAQVMIHRLHATRRLLAEVTAKSP